MMPCSHRMQALSYRRFTLHQVLSLYTSQPARGRKFNAGLLHTKTLWGVEHGIEDGTF